MKESLFNFKDNSKSRFYLKHNDGLSQLPRSQGYLFAWLYNTLKDFSLEMINVLWSAEDIKKQISHTIFNLCTYSNRKICKPIEIGLCSYSAIQGNSKYMQSFPANCHRWKFLHLEIRAILNINTPYRMPY